MNLREIGRNRIIKLVIYSTKALGFFNCFLQISQVEPWNFLHTWENCMNFYPKNALFYAIIENFFLIYDV